MHFPPLLAVFRKLIINGVLVHIHNEDIRLGIGFASCFLSLVLSFAARPFASPKLNHLLLSGLSIQTLTLAYGLLLIVLDNVRGDTATSRNEMKALEWVVTLVRSPLSRWPLSCQRLVLTTSTCFS